MLAAGLIVGAIGAHLTKLGIVVQDDGGLLFTLALVDLVGALIIIFLRRRQLPVMCRNSIGGNHTGCQHFEDAPPYDLRSSLEVKWHL